MTHQLAIGQLNNQCLLYGHTYEEAFINSELRHCTEHRLSRALAEEVDRQLSNSLSSKGFYRIKKIDIDLTLSRSEFSAGELSKIFAAKIAFSLKEKIESHQHDIQVFTSEGDFIAEFINDLLRGNAWSHWQYEEFSALRHISDTEAAVQILLTRWKIIEDIITGLSHRRALTTLISSVDERQAHTLILHWRSKTSSKDVFSNIAEFNRALEELDNTLIHKNITYNSRAKDGLNLLFRIIKDIKKTQLSVNTCFIFSDFIVSFAYFYYRHSSFTSTLLQGRPLPPLNTLKEDLRTFGEHLVSAVKNRRKIIEVLQKIVNLLNNKRSSAPKKSAEEDSQKEIAKLEHGDEKVFYSQSAGLGLLIPIIISLGLHTTTSAQTLRNSVIAILGNNERSSRGCNTWLRHILPDTDNINDQTLTERWRIGIDTKQQEKIERTNGIEKITSILLAHFAARLSGMQQSSALFLSEQFLQRPGKIIITDSSIEVILEPIPLYIVLQISGLKGWNEKLPWLEKIMCIDIET